MRSFFKKYFLQINARTIYIYSVITGILSGSVALLFYKAINGLSHFFEINLTHMPLLQPGGPVLNSETLATEPNRLLFFLMPIIGGLVTGAIIHFFGSEARGGGTEVFLDAFHNKVGHLRKRTGIIKFLASVASLSTGASGGKEGPMTLIGASIGSFISKFIKMGARARRTLLLAGAAGGLGAIFRTPLGGAITAVEVLYKEDFESDSLIPCIISSVSAYTTFGAFAGYGHILKFTTDTFHSPIELVFYAILALVCAGAGFVFVKIYQALDQSFFKKIPIPAPLLPAFGGILVGCVGLFVPEVLGGGLGVVQQAIYGSYSLDWWVACQFFLLLAVLKMFTTGFTIQSGGSAGLLVPAFFIGAMLGGFCGTLFHHFFPSLVPSPTPFIVVGMAAFFAAVSNASLGALVMVTEITGGYELLPPLMLVAVISLIFSHKWSLYKNQVPNKFFSKAHLWDMNPAMLKQIHIGDALKIYNQQTIVDSNMLLSEINTLARKLHVSEFLVRNASNQLVGILTLHDLEFEDAEDLSELSGLLVAEDMMHNNPPAVTREHTLFKAMQILTNTDFDKVPVVKHTPKRNTLLGYLTRRDILKYYNDLGTQTESSIPTTLNN